MVCSSKVGAALVHDDTLLDKYLPVRGQLLPKGVIVWIVMVAEGQRIMTQTDRVSYWTGSVFQGNIDTVLFNIFNASLDFQLPALPPSLVARCWFQFFAF